MTKYREKLLQEIQGTAAKHKERKSKMPYLEHYLKGMTDRQIAGVGQPSATEKPGKEKAIRVIVPGRPVPKARPRLGVRGRKAYGKEIS